MAIHKPRAAPSQCRPHRRPGLSLEADNALGIVTAVLFDPDEAAIAVGRLVGGELVGTSFSAGLVEIFFVLRELIPPL